MRSEFTCDWHANCSLAIRCCRRARRSLCHLEHNLGSEAGSSCYYYLIPTRSLFSACSNQQSPIPLWPWESITNSKLEVSERTRASILFLSFFHYVFLIPTAVHQPDLKFHGDRDHVFYFIHSTSTDWPPARVVPGTLGNRKHGKTSLCLQGRGNDLVVNTLFCFM